MNELLFADDAIPKSGASSSSDKDFGPRQRLLREGVAKLSDRDLLVILLVHGGATINVEALSQAVLDHFQGLRAMSQAEPEVWYQIKGIGPARCAAVCAALELGRRALAQSIQRDEPLKSPQAAERYVHALLADRPREVFACLFLDTRHRAHAYTRV